MSRWTATLPMYNVTPQHGRLWRALLRDALEAFARAGGPGDFVILEEAPDELMPLWRRPDLLLSQTCGFPYRMLGLQEAVHLVATPVFDAEGCEGAHYRSAIAVSAAAWARGATTLAACRGLRAACNGKDSHSGMNALRHAAAPLARDGRFFSSLIWTGSHLNSLLALSAEAADIAAIDCVTLAFLRDACPEKLRDVKIIGMTALAPGLPFIASRALGDRLGALLFDALESARQADAGRARSLRLHGFARLASSDYAPIEQMAQFAAELGYGELR
ncbi:phosphate ABC transporter substrate-binding protein [Trinickia terrae]|uniref:Phosphate ABC transporter substrate-binding protein n=1 Tax=Trinickia terrae TaxID=2571161 RepID=A0A4U1HXG4_9BURK|nr:PhnD/SsuA/transferrin family substrate-binding protein [Trinickia terrae]TKC86351.1 phosphate ABC transporter substrate-binding protein [Trinickia terrae]